MDRRALAAHGGMKLLAAFILAGITLCAPLLRAAEANGDDLPHVRCDGHRLMFGWHGGAPHRVDIAKLIRSATLDTAHVVAAERAGEIDYFLVSVSGPSSAGTGDTSSVNGTETSLLWLKLKSWKLLDSQSMPYQSFWDSLEPIGDYHLKSGILTIRYTNRRESTDYVLRYDLARPDDKIILQRAGDVE